MKKYTPKYTVFYKEQNGNKGLAHFHELTKDVAFAHARHTREVARRLGHTKTFVRIYERTPEKLVLVG